MFEFIAFLKSTTTLLKIGNVNIFIEITVSNLVHFLGKIDFSIRTYRVTFEVLLPGPEEHLNLKKRFKH